MSPIRLLQMMKKFDIGGVERSTINLSNKLADHLEYIAIFAGKGKLDHSNIITGKVNIFFSYENIAIRLPPSLTSLNL